MLERNILYPVVFLACITSDSPVIVRKLGPYPASVVITICGLKCLRSSFSQPPVQYLILAFACLFFQLDYAAASETFLIDYFITAIAFSRIHEFLLKVGILMLYQHFRQEVLFSGCVKFCKMLYFDHLGFRFDILTGNTRLLFYIK
jgi:hypothetical protein